MTEMPPGLNSRDRVLWAAATMLGESSGAALTVRAVAARAGVSVGSLRHHFPTQRILIDAVMKLVYDMTMPRGVVDDASVPARDRLRAYLTSTLSPTDDYDAAHAWRLTFSRYVDDSPTEEAREEYRAIERGMVGGIEHFLDRLEHEGALPKGDNARRAKFLVSIITGISVARALPHESTRPRDDLDVLDMAVDAVFSETSPAITTEG